MNPFNGDYFTRENFINIFHGVDDQIVRNPIKSGWMSDWVSGSRTLGGPAGLVLDIAGSLYSYSPWGGISDVGYTSTDFAASVSTDLLISGGSTLAGVGAGTLTTLVSAGIAGATGGSVVPGLGTAIGLVAGIGTGILLSTTVGDRRLQRGIKKGLDNVVDGAKAVGETCPRMIGEEMRESMSQKYTGNPTKILYAFIAFTAGAGLWAIDYAEPPAYINAIIIGLIVLLTCLTVYMWRKNKEKLVIWVRVYTIINGDLIALFLLIGSWALFGERLWLGMVYLVIYAGCIMFIHLDPRRAAYFFYRSKVGTYLWVIFFLSFIFILPHYRVVDFLADEEIKMRAAFGMFPVAVLVLVMCHCIWVYIKYPDWTAAQWKSSK